MHTKTEIYERKIFYIFIFSSRDRIRNKSGMGSREIKGGGIKKEKKLKGGMVVKSG